MHAAIRAALHTFARRFETTPQVPAPPAERPKASRGGPYRPRLGFACSAKRDPHDHETLLLHAVHFAGAGRRLLDVGRRSRAGADQQQPQVGGRFARPPFRGRQRRRAPSGDLGQEPWRCAACQGVDQCLQQRCGTGGLAPGHPGPWRFRALQLSVSAGPVGHGADGGAGSAGHARRCDRHLSQPRHRAPAQPAAGRRRCRASVAGIGRWRGARRQGHWHRGAGFRYRLSPQEHARQRRRDTGARRGRLRRHWPRCGG